MLVLPGFSKFHSSCTPQTLKMKAVFSFEISGNTNPATQHDIPEQLDTQQH